MKQPGLFFIIVAVLFLSCSGKNKSSSSSDEPNEATEETVESAFTYETFTDIQKFTNSEDVNFTHEGSSYVKFDYPTGQSIPDVLISDWLKSQMKGMKFSFIPTEFDRNSVSKLNQSFAKTVEDMISDSYFSANLVFKCQCTLSTDKVVAYELDYSILVSPGSPGIYAQEQRGVTYDIAKREALTWNIIPASNRAKFDQVLSKIILQKGIYRSLSDFKDEYFENSHFVDSESLPIFTRNGIIWRQSGGYFKNEINITIPYDALIGIVNPEVAALFPSETQEKSLIEERKALIPAYVKRLYGMSDSEHEEALTEEYQQYKKLAEKINHVPGDALIIDWDPWVGGQDVPFNDTYSTGAITMNSPEKATVKIIQTYQNCSDCPKESRVCSTLELVWQNGAWKVNDVGGTLERYKEYLIEHGVKF